jgi:hypothetical protein
LLDNRLNPAGLAVILHDEDRLVWRRDQFIPGCRDHRLGEIQKHAPRIGTPAKQSASKDAITAAQIQKTPELSWSLSDNEEDQLNLLRG